MGPRQRALMGVVLLAALALPLGSYFWAAYKSDAHGNLPLEERMLTAHDDLFAIHLDGGRTGWLVGNA